MLDELDLQKKICDAVEHVGGHAFKCSNRFLIGVVDISMKIPGYPHVYNEVKLVKPWPKKAATVSLDVTPKQNKFLKDYRNAGGKSLYTVFGHDGVRWLWHIGHDLTIERLPCLVFEPCPRWVEPELMVAKFEAFLTGMEKMGI